MNTLIIYSNHHENNFNHQLLEKLKTKMTSHGNAIVVRDLYALDFDPVLRLSDFEQMSAGRTPSDIKKEQDFVRWADSIVFIYPVWWGGMPAIVKGYIDKVFSWGFAYASGDNGAYPLLMGKKAVVMNTLGQSRQEYEQGMFQAMQRVNAEGVFGFCGIELSEQLYFPSIHQVSNAELQAYLEQAVRAVESLEMVP